MRPETNAYRERVPLGGFWDGAPDLDDRGVTAGWADGFDPLGPIAVPGSINEQWAERGLRDTLGPFWLQREFVVPAAARGRRARLHFPSADLSARVWWDGKEVGANDAPFLPFDALLGVLEPGRRHRLVVRLDSRLPATHPLPGITAADFHAENRAGAEVFPPVRYDFFPFSGLHREPSIGFEPLRGLRALQLRPGWSGHRGTLAVHAEVDAGIDALVLRLEQADGDWMRRIEIGAGGLAEALLDDLPVQPWAPETPNRYRLQLEACRDGEVADAVERRLGFRDVCVDGAQLRLNGSPIQLRGFGLHEDFPVLGKGQCLALTVKDFELMRWCGANSFRTSHYPYAEDTLELAETLGLMVISEVASVNLDFRRVTEATLAQHCAHLETLIARDGERACVIAWSLTNEPGYLAEAEYAAHAPAYFDALFAHARRLDPSRPLTAANVGSRHGLIDPLYAHCDFLSLNRYLGWYELPAQLDVATARLKAELDALAEHFPAKPILFTEFGADAVAGMHSTTPQLFTEEYQAELIARYWALIAAHPQCIGGHVWNLADFRTAQHFRRVVLNHKGVFTRTRDPKAAAWRLRQLWRGLSPGEH
ncbi:MAG: glycoside hydrolase family 2 TIM barrel-domain containing protein [Silanimonas sp.]